MKDFICEYFNGKGDSPFAEDYTAFCDWIHDHRDFSREITSGVLTNLDLKKSMAKKIVSDMMNGSDEYREQEIIDNRLRSLVTYYFSVMLFSQDARMAESAAGAYRKYRSPELDFPLLTMVGCLENVLLTIQEKLLSPCGPGISCIAITGSLSSTCSVLPPVGS